MLLLFLSSSYYFILCMILGHYKGRDLRINGGRGHRHVSCHHVFF